jgi:hypothetical protein
MHDAALPRRLGKELGGSEKRLVELLRAGIGVPDCPVKIDGVGRGFTPPAGVVSQTLSNNPRPT